MLDQAIAKIKDEMTKNQSDHFIQEVGKFLLQHLESNPAAAERILNTDKTIAKSFNELEKTARQRKGNKNYAHIPPQEGFEIILKFFGIDAGAGQAQVVAVQPAPKKAAAVDFDISLDDLLA